MTSPNQFGSGAVVQSPPNGLVEIDTGGAVTAVFGVWSGTVTLNGNTPVTVANANITASSVILFGLKTVGGTVGAMPTPQTVTPGTGFTVEGSASDTSTYNYLIIG